MRTTIIAALAALAWLLAAAAPAGAKRIWRHTDILNLATGDFDAVADTAEYDLADGRFSTSRMLLTDNVALFWEPEFGADPAAAPGELRMPLGEIVEEVDSFYRFYYHTLGFVEPGRSCVDRYYLNLYIFSHTSDGAIYAVNPEPIGYMCIHPFWFNRYGSYLGGVAHELAHTFQGAANIAGAPQISPVMAEMCAQFMISSYYGDWPRREPEHISAFMQSTHLGFTHFSHCYNSPWVLEYWAQRHGRDIMGRLWRYHGSYDPVERYKQMTEMDQEAFADEMFDAVRRFPTWDIAAGNEAYDPYRDSHFFKVKPLGGGSYKSADNLAPRGYGYNAVRLNLPAGADRRVEIDFEGLADEGRNSRRDLMGWRYGLAAGMADGTTAYSPAGSDPAGRIAWEVPRGARSLWLVVMGAPSEHYVTDRHGAYCDDEFPWRVTLRGTGVSGYATLPIGHTPGR